MVVSVFGKFPCSQQFVVLQRLPTVLDRIERRVEDNTVRVQMRIKGTGGFMREQRRGEVARAPIALRSTRANSSGSKRLEFTECRLHRPRMGLKNANVLAKKSHERNGLGR